MNYVADTMAIVLLIEGRQTASSVQQIFFDTLAHKNIIFIPAIAVVEIGYLYQKGRIEASIEDVRSLATGNFKIIDLSLDVISATFEIKDIPELHDRLIAGTARHMRLPVITNDPVIANSKFVTTVWK